MEDKLSQLERKYTQREMQLQKIIESAQSDAERERANIRQHYECVIQSKNEKIEQFRQEVNEYIKLPLQLFATMRLCMCMDGWIDLCQFRH